jgi:hypothetical protein
LIMSRAAIIALIVAMLIVAVLLGQMAYGGS